MFLKKVSKFRGLLPTIILFLLLFLACSEDDPVTPDPDPEALLVVEFDNFHYWGEPREGFVFISDKDGSLLDCASFTCDSRVILRNEERQPEYVSMTLFYNTAFYPQLITEFEIPAGSTVIIPNQAQAAPTGSVSVQYRNVSGFNSLHVSTIGLTVSYFSHVPVGDRYSVVGEAMDMYVQAVPDTGTPIGSWLYDVRAGDTDTLDLESSVDFSPLNAHRIGIPQGATQSSCGIYSTTMVDPFRQYLMLDYASVDPESEDTMIAYLPTTDLSDVITMFTQTYEGSPNTIYQTRIRGPLPEAISIWEGELEVVSAQVDSIVIQADFTWSEFKSYWRQDKEGYPRWWVNGPSSSEDWGLPEYPEELVEELSEYPRNDFLLAQIQVVADSTGETTYIMGRSFPYGENSKEQVGYFEGLPLDFEVRKMRP